MVEVNGIEPMTFPLVSGTLSQTPFRPYPEGLDGGGERDRTDDLLRARQALSQLSYTPESCLRSR